jgi:predicted Ser/Thr protein kinase
MDTNYLERCIASIKVRNLVNEDVEVENLSPLPMIGKGRQGAVFQFTEDICVKVFGNPEDCEREYYALSLGQHTNLFPKLYHKGPLHIAMETIRGIDLREYLLSQPLSKELSVKLIEMLITFKEIGYERIDHHKRQVYLLEDGSLKVIDVARTVWRDRVYPYPRKLLNSLGNKNKEIFLAHVQELSPVLYDEWRHYIRMEELACEIYQVLLESPGKNTDVVSALSEKLYTTHDEERYVVLMAGLMHKVYKEQWLKTMLARGEDTVKVYEKIDEYWDKQKREFKELKESENNRENSDGGNADSSTAKQGGKKKWQAKGNDTKGKKAGNAKSKNKGKDASKKEKEKTKSKKGKYSKWLTFGLM